MCVLGKCHVIDFCELNILFPQGTVPIHSCWPSPL